MLLLMILIEGLASQYHFNLGWQAIGKRSTPVATGDSDAEKYS
jgi:hypothetical protein